MPRLPALALLALLAAALPAPARAAGPAQAAPITLEEAVGLALERNETPRIAAARLERARAGRREAFSALLPRLTVTGTYTRRAYEIERAGQGRDALGTGATFDTTLFDPSALPALEITERRIEAQEQASAELRRQLAFDVAEAYLAVLSAEQVARAADERLAYASDVVKDARLRLEAGLGDRQAITRSELELAAARVSQTQARLGVRTTRNLLSTLVGEPVTRELANPPAIEDGPADPAAAGRDRPDLRALELEADAARLFAREPWLRLIPSLGLRGTARAANETGFGGRNWDWNVAATVTWVVFDGGLRYAQAAARAAQADEASLQADALRRRIAFELENASAELDAARAALEQARAREAIAVRNAGEVRERFRTGLAGTLEQADASLNAFEAKADEARQTFALHRAALSLTAALGRWPTENTK